MLYDENNSQQSYESQEIEYLDMCEVHLTTNPIGDISYSDISDVITSSDYDRYIYEEELC